MERTPNNGLENEQGIRKGVLQTLPKEPLNKQSFKNMSSLNLNDCHKYRLIDIDLLDTKDYRDVYKDIIFLDISNNSISSLKLKGYNLLEVIKAENNSLTKIELNLPRLTILDLTDNMITKFFELNSIPMLSDLKLNKNAINKITFEDLRSVKNTLTSLDLSQNRIDFTSVQEFFDLFDQIGKSMKRLTSLNLSNNTFNQQHNKVYYRESAEFILKNCLGLKYLNGKLIGLQERDGLHSFDAIKKKMVDSEKLDGPHRIKALEMLSENNILPNTISLSFINKKMESYSMIGRLNKVTFKDFKVLVELYLTGAVAATQSEDNNMRFEDNEIEDFETFLEYCTLLSDATPSVESMLLELVANFSNIKNGKFAFRAITFLALRMTPEKIKMTEEIISRIIVDHLCKISEENINAIIIKCLEAFLAQPKFVASLKKLIRKLILAIKKFNKINFLNSKSSEENSIKELYLCATSFVSSACVNIEYLTIIAKDADLNNCIEFKIKSLLNDNDSKIGVDLKALEILKMQLNIVRSICLFKEDSPSAIAVISQFLGSGLKDKLEQSLNERLQVNKKTEVKAESALKLNYTKKQTFANMIRCYGALLYRLENLKIYVDNKQSIPNKILNILTQNGMDDPIIISAACDFALYFLNNKKMLINEDGIFDTTAKNLYNLRYILQYLFQDRNEYKSACELADKYGDDTLLRGKVMQLSLMNSELINNLIISIVNLIEFFGRKTKTESKIKATCSAVCQDLNDQSRDFALTRCLSASNNEVKLAVVKCLFSVDSSQLNVEEIGLIWREAQNVNLMGGIVEKILTVIFLILNKCFIYCLRKGKFEVIDQIRDVFNIAFDILLKNEESGYLYEIDSNQRSSLSVAICTLIFNCSCFEQLKSFLLDAKHANKIFKILYFENNCRDLGNNIPLGMEKTRPGCKIENLIDCFNNETYSIDPYTYISLRILIHIANVLMGISYTAIEWPEYETYEELILFLKNEFTNRLCDSIYYECQTFRRLVDDKIKNAKPQKLSIDLSEQDRMEEQLKFLKHFPMLVDYIYGQLNPNKVNNFKIIFKDKFDKEIVNYSYNMKYFQTEKKEFSLKEDSEVTSIYEIFVNYLREEEYCDTTNSRWTTDYDYITQDKLIFEKFGLDRNITRKNDEETPDNPYIRSLFIAAFLRCIYAILEFSVEKNIRKEMIKILFTGDNIKTISMLTDCTKLLDNNISSKYIIIVRYLLLNSNVFFEIHEKSAESSDSYLTKIGIISYMIRKMVRVNCKDIQLDTDDTKIFFSEVSGCSWIIINQLQIMDFKTSELRMETSNNFINQDIISVLIQIIKDHMNRDAKSLKKSDNKNNEVKIKNLAEDHMMIEMISSISLIIGEYMSICKSSSYTIIESLTRGYIFEKVKMRKTYMREIIEYSKLSDLKIKITYYLKTRVHLVSRVCVNKFEEESHFKLMIISDEFIEFLDIDDPLDERSDWNMTVFKLNENMRINIQDIDAVIQFELPNRLLIKLKDYIFYNFFFIKINVVTVLIFILRFINSSIKYYNKIPIFVDEKYIEKQNRDLKNEILSIRPDFEQFYKGVSSDGEESPKSEVKEEEAELEDVIIFCITIQRGFFNFITDLFKKKQIIENGRIVVIKNKKLMIFEEILDEWNKINIERIFKTALMKQSTERIFLYNFMHCFKLIFEINLDKGLVDYTTSGIDKVTISFENGPSISFTMLDDISIVRFNHAVMPFLPTNNPESKDEFYDEIN